LSEAQAAVEQAVVVLGHGSRNPAAQQVLGTVVSLLESSTGWTVAEASLDFNHPTLPEAAADLYARGFRRIVLAPYLLYAGNHVAKDVPRLLEEIKATHPGLEIEVAEPLGLDPAIVGVLGDRVRAARGEEGEVASDPTMTPAEIEERSFQVIESLLPDSKRDALEKAVVTRVVHATGDPGLAIRLQFSPGALESGRRALSLGAPVFTDVNMVRAGVEPSLRRIGVEVSCLVDTPRARERAQAEAITRSAAALRELGSRLDGSVVAIGNAPTALLELVRLADQGIEPALVVGVPVGFVAAAESKRQLMDSALPYATLPGLRGGTPIAVAIVNALARKVTRN